MTDTLARALTALSFEPTISRVVARAEWNHVRDVARWVNDVNPYHERAALVRALRLSGSDATEPLPHIEHQLWCAWREAGWNGGAAEPLPITVEGKAWLAETTGHPTIVISPMTLASGDALCAIRMLKGERPCIVFGERVAIQQAERLGVDAVDEESVGTVRRIHDVLRDGGMLCTYPDFVYAGHSTFPMELFGTMRPVASGFLSFASMRGAMLLPVMCRKRDNEIVVGVDEPLHVQGAGGGYANRSHARAAMADAVAAILESQIRRAPEQWRLLATLTFDSPQMQTGGLGEMTTRSPGYAHAP
jgi:hypothetical protein